MMRHTGAHFTGMISIHDNKINFIDYANEVIESLDDIFSQNPAGWFFGVYVNCFYIPKVIRVCKFISL